jgi:hypothetical protein
MTSAQPSTVRDTVHTLIINVTSMTTQHAGFRLCGPPHKCILHHLGSQFFTSKFRGWPLLHRKSPSCLPCCFFHRPSHPHFQRINPVKSASSFASASASAGAVVFISALLVYLFISTVNSQLTMAPITRAVRFLSTIHTNVSNLRSGNVTYNGLARKTILSSDHFPKFLGAWMLLSVYAGWATMDSIRTRQVRIDCHCRCGCYYFHCCCCDRCTCTMFVDTC